MSFDSADARKGNPIIQSQFSIGHWWGMRPAALLIRVLLHPLALSLDPNTHPLGPVSLRVLFS